MKTQTQIEFVYNHLIDHGYITQLVANNYGIRRLASRMNDLKNLFIDFDVEIRRDESGSRYAYYFLRPMVRDYERSMRDRMRCIAA